jgi:hypothetical protein
MSKGPKHVFYAVQEDAIFMTTADVRAVISSLFCQNHSRAKERHGMLNISVVRNVVSKSGVPQYTVHCD